jgi:hypothetical protein
MSCNRRCVSAVVALLLAVALALPAAGGPGTAKGPGKDVKIMKITKAGDAYCFAGALVFGSVVIAGGRCYTFYLFRTPGGLFLGFGPPGPPMIPPGQLVRMGTPAGQKLKGRLFYTVPVSTSVTIIAVDTIQFVSVVVTPQPGKVVITVPKGAAGSTQTVAIDAVFLER